MGLTDTIKITIAPKDPETYSELGAYIKGYSSGAEMAINAMTEMAKKKNRKPLRKRRTLK